MIDRDDQPVASTEVTLEAFGGAVLQAVTTEPVGGARPGLALADTSFRQSVTAGPDGSFRFTGVSPGSYRLNALPPANLKTPIPREGKILGWTRTFYRSAPDANSATTIEVAAGSKLTGQDIRICAVPVYRVAGIVTTLAGRPAAGIRVRIEPDDEARPRAVTTVSKADGTFSFPAIRDGGWRLSASSKSGAKESRGFEWVHVAGRDVSRIAVRLGPPFAVRGTIQVPGNPESPGGCIVLAPDEGGPDSTPSCGATREFTVTNVFRRSYWVQPLAFPTFRENDYYLESITLGDRDILGQAVQLKPNSPALHIVYKEGGGTLKGVVADCEKATVIALPQEAALRKNMHYRFTRRASCGDGGSFRIRNVRPGSYFVFALEDDLPQPNEFQELDQSLTTKAKIVTIREGEIETLDLRVISR